MIASGRVDAAVDALIDLIKRDRSFRDGPGLSSPRGVLFKLFAAMGSNHPLAVSGRKKLSAALFM